MAILLLAAWLPVLLYVDHWPAPDIFAPQQDVFGAERNPFHSHSADTAASHVDHGHGGGADGSATPLIPAPSYEAIEAGRVAWAIEPLPQFAVRLNVQTPPLPPPR